MDSHFSMQLLWTSPTDPEHWQGEINLGINNLLIFNYAPIKKNHFIYIYILSKIFFGHEPCYIRFDCKNSSNKKKLQLLFINITITFR